MLNAHLTWLTIDNESGSDLQWHSERVLDKRRRWDGCFFPSSSSSSNPPSHVHLERYIFWIDIKTANQDVKEFFLTSWKKFNLPRAKNTGIANLLTSLHFNSPPEANFSMASVRIGERLQYEPRVSKNQNRPWNRWSISYFFNAHHWKIALWLPYDVERKGNYIKIKLSHNQMTIPELSVDQS